MFSRKNLLDLGEDKMQYYAALGNAFGHPKVGTKVEQVAFEFNQLRGEGK